MLSPVAFIIRAAPWRLQIRGESVRRTIWGQALQWLVLETRLGQQGNEDTTDAQAQEEKLGDGEPRYWFWKLSWLEIYYYIHLNGGLSLLDTGESGGGFS